MDTEVYLALERREISRSMASRMNSPRLFGPANASMRAATSSVRRMSTGLVADLVLSGGRPMRPVVADIGKSVNIASKVISLIDVVSDIGYDFNIEAQETQVIDKFAAVADKLEADAAGIRSRVGRASATSQHIMRAEAAALERCARAIRKQIEELEAV